MTARSNDLSFLTGLLSPSIDQHPKQMQPSNHDHKPHIPNPESRSPCGLIICRLNDQRSSTVRRCCRRQIRSMRIYRRAIDAITIRRLGLTRSCRLRLVRLTGLRLIATTVMAAAAVIVAAARLWVIGRLRLVGRLVSRLIRWLIRRRRMVCAHRMVGTLGLVCWLLRICAAAAAPAGTLTTIRTAGYCSADPFAVVVCGTATVLLVLALQRG